MAKRFLVENKEKGEKMSKSLNKVQLIGNLGRDPEARYTTSGKAVANFTVATNESWLDNENNQQERTEWHRIVVWGKLAEICGEYLNKGKQVYIEGRIQTRKWEDKDGEEQSSTEIVANQMLMLSGKAEKCDCPPPRKASDDAETPF